MAIQQRKTTLERYLTKLEKQVNPYERQVHFFVREYATGDRTIPGKPSKQI